MFRLQYNRSVRRRCGGPGELPLVTEGTSLEAWTRLPAAQRSSPSWRKHTWLALQDVGLQVMLPWTEHVQRAEQVFSGYQLSPNCGAWPSSAEPIGNLETGDGWSPPQPRRVTAFGPFPSPIFLPSSPPSFPSFFFLPCLPLFLSPPTAIFLCSSHLFFETGFYYVAQAALELMTLLPQPSKAPSFPGFDLEFFSASWHPALSSPPPMLCPVPPLLRLQGLQLPGLFSLASPHPQEASRRASPAIRPLTR